jgi:hypothetical protein
VPVAAPHGGHEVEARGADVASFDAVHALDLAEQAIVVAHRVAAIGEAVGREIAVVAREALLDRAAERDLVARGGDLVLVGQARRIGIDGAAHAERARLAGHQLSELLLGAADRLGDHHGRVIGRLRHQALDRILDLEGLARAQAELGRRHAGGMLGNRHAGVELELAGLELLEQQVERHDLGERGGMADAVRIGRVQRLACIGVHHQRRVRRVVRRVGHPLATARVGRVAAQRDHRDHHGETTDPPTQAAHRPNSCAHDHVPVPRYARRDMRPTSLLCSRL